MYSRPISFQLCVSKGTDKFRAIFMLEIYIFETF